MVDDDGGGGVGMCFWKSFQAGGGPVFAEIQARPGIAGMSRPFFMPVSGLIRSVS